MPSRKITVRLLSPSPRSTATSPLSLFAICILYGGDRGDLEGHIGRHGTVRVSVALEALDVGPEGDRLHSSRKDEAIVAQETVLLVRAQRRMGGVDGLLRYYRFILPGAME